MRVAGDQNLTLLLQFLFEVSLDLVGIFSEELFLAFISILHLKEEVVSLIVSERTLKSYDVDLREILGDHIPEFVAFFLLINDNVVDKRNFYTCFFHCILKEEIPCVYVRSVDREKTVLIKNLGSPCNKRFCIFQLIFDVVCNDAAVSLVLFDKTSCLFLLKITEDKIDINTFRQVAFVFFKELLKVISPAAADIVCENLGAARNVLPVVSPEL